MRAMKAMKAMAAKKVVKKAMGTTETASSAAVPGPAWSWQRIVSILVFVSLSSVFGALGFSSCTTCVAKLLAGLWSFTAEAVNTVYAVSQGLPWCTNCIANLPFGLWFLAAALWNLILIALYLLASRMTHGTVTAAAGLCIHPARFAGKQRFDGLYQRHLRRLRRFCQSGRELPVLRPLGSISTSPSAMLRWTKDALAKHRWADQHSSPPENTPPPHDAAMEEAPTWCRRLLFRLWWQTKPDLNSPDPLLGGGRGGSRATARKRVEGSTLASLAAAVSALSQKIEQIQQQQGKNRSPTKRRSRAQGFQGESRAATEALPPKQEGSLLDRLLLAFQQLKAKNELDDARVREALLRVVGSPATQPAVKPDPATPSRTWSQVVGNQQSGENSKAAPTCTLHAPSWEGSVVPAQSLKTHSLEGKLVISCQNPVQQEEAEVWLKARGCKQPHTFVTFNSTDPQSCVLVQSSLGPKPARATIQYVGDDAPRQRRLPEGVHDDADQKVEASPTCLLRLVLAKDFAEPGLYEQASRAPKFLPALLLPRLRHVVLQTRRATTFPAEVSCLLIVKDSDVDSILLAALPTGAFLNKHQDKGAPAPQWINRAATESAGDYWKQATALKETCGGRLVYRSTKTVSLGLLGSKTTAAGALPPRWYLTGGPTGWVESDLQQWAEQRGFLNCNVCQRCSRSAWIFRAFPPAGTGDRLPTLTFASGINVAPAAKHAKKPAAPTAAPKDAWGAPAVPPVAATPAPQHPRGPPPPQAPRKDNDGDVNIADDRRPSPDGGDAKKPRTASSLPPFDGMFDLIDNEGKGDCAYLAIARSLAEANAKTRSLDQKDLAAGGRLQAQLRILASKELAKHRETYLLDPQSTVPQQTAEAGVWADSVSLSALATACNLELRIWSWSSSMSRWDLYVVSSLRPSKQAHQVVWLYLKDQHYQLLRPTSKFVPQTALDWLKQACYKPRSLAGAGETLDPEALRILGLCDSPSGVGANGEDEQPCPHKGAGRSIDAVDIDALACMGLCPSPCTSHPSADASGRSPDRQGRTTLPSTAAQLAPSAQEPEQRVKRRLRTKTSQADPKCTAVDATEEPPNALAAAVPPNATPVDIQYVAGSHCRCQCGWHPPQNCQKRCDRIRLSRQHWATCQGLEPPKSSKQDRIAIVAQACVKAHESLQAKGVANFKRWLQNLRAKGPAWIEAACQPDITAKPVYKHRACYYSCKQCGRTTTLSKFKALGPCKARRSTHITKEMWMGKDKYAAQLGRNLRAVHRYVKKQKRLSKGTPARPPAQGL